MIEIGIDIESIDRFKKYNLENNSDFLRSIFSEKELEYCFSTKSSAKHLAARFCGKEAVIKTLNNMKNADIQYKDIEVLNNKDGSPYINIKKLKKSTFKISLSHTSEYAVAFAIRME